jgi:uncharacterized damage-inducible protein DinB
VYASAALLDLHSRVHRSLGGFLEHCAGFSADELNRELGGFGYPSIRTQLYHMIWAEDVWMGRVRDDPLIEQRAADCPDLASLLAYRERVAAATREFLLAAEDLRTKREMTLGEGQKRALVPAHVLFRIATHTYQHQGQLAAMFRLLGKPIPAGLDFPLIPLPEDPPVFHPAEIADVHRRAQQSLRKLLDHCAGFTPDELSRELEGFGYASIRMQLHHVIGANEYWVGVLRGLMLVEERPEDFASIEALRAYRERVAETTAAYLSGASETELSTARKLTTWGGHERELIPALVILRTQTHVYQHQGQIAAMSRLLGKPVPPGLDFSLV